MSVVCCQVEVSATGRSLVQKSPIDCGASLSVNSKRHEWGGHGPLGAVEPKKKSIEMQCFVIAWQSVSSITHSDLINPYRTNVENRVSS